MKLEIAAKKLGLHPRTLKRHIWSGLIRGEKINYKGKKWRWEVSEETVDSYLHYDRKCTCSYWKARYYGVMFKDHAPTCPLFKSSSQTNDPNCHQTG